MLSNLKRYHRPKSIPEALALLEKNSGSILVIAGGTKLVPSNNNVVEELVDITGLNLGDIDEEGGALRIGATTTLQKIADSPILRSHASGVISNAARLSSNSRMIRNVATLGGQLVTTNSFSVMYCALLILQAQVRIAGGEEFALAMNIFLNKKQLAGGLLVEVLIPPVAPNTYAALSPVISPKTATPLICGAARVTILNNECIEAKIAVTGTPRVPQRLHAVEEELQGCPFTEENILKAAETAYQLFEPVGDELASEEYRKEVSRVVVKRALERCRTQAYE